MVPEMVIFTNLSQISQAQTNSPLIFSVKYTGPTTSTIPRQNINMNESAIPTDAASPIRISYTTMVTALSMLLTVLLYK